ncbi:hypothetical protein FZ103_21245 [Streptomonospora sp. PA3]|nr:hypothetical protein [Streptomonospora sp. PA3]
MAHDKIAFELQAEVCSPRMRGWFRRRRHPIRRPGVLPAHAGMVPVLGDGPPSDTVLPAHAGMVRFSGRHIGLALVSTSLDWQVG